MLSCPGIPVVSRQKWRAGAEGPWPGGGRRGHGRRHWVGPEGLGAEKGELLGASRPAGADPAGLARGLWAPELVRGSWSRMQSAISKNAVGASGASCR